MLSLLGMLPLGKALASRFVNQIHNRTAGHVLQPGAIACSAVSPRAMQCRWREHAIVQRGISSDGTVQYAVDATENPLADTCVWLHMYEGPGGLEYSFDERTGAAQYMYDHTGFQEWRVERNSLLSDDAKCLMFRLWKEDEEMWSDVNLAKLFRIRVQRAIAILKIKQDEFDQVSSRQWQHCLPSSTGQGPRLHIRFQLRAQQMRTDAIPAGREMTNALSHLTSACACLTSTGSGTCYLYCIVSFQSRQIMPFTSRFERC
jgi:hypothetical protein